MPSKILPGTILPDRVGFESTGAVMNIDHVHFYVEDASRWQKWFTQTFGFQQIATHRTAHSITVELGNSAIRFWVSSPCSQASPIAAYLQRHPAGVADLAFQVASLETVLQRAVEAGATILQPIQYSQSRQQKTAQIRGWGDLQHTLIEPIHASSPANPDRFTSDRTGSEFIGIDHVVLNVEQGDLERAIGWYEAVFGLQRRQNFAIQTERSGLCSQVLCHPGGSVQFPINEPASSTSQIQEFLDWNRGPGIQHLALRTDQILPLIAQLRQRGLAFLSVPMTYYEQLGQRPGFQFSLQEWQAMAQQEVLADWPPDNPQALLLQAFTQPIFDQPTFFFELIERRTYRLEMPYGQNHQPMRTAEGFGEGNFRALFEAIEREQIKRGSLR
ncbi:4-hydroxyphenylpyruvate dioxygenase [Leptolyngbya sp. NK1-12]|nr:4-hydroxyphenylpyruvate dioxygenase [Leptolyngbya sp. NK1-12]